MKHFDFDEWRLRYMRWMNDNKSRVMDFFRKQDRDHDGKITRQEFIDGILQSSMSPMSTFSPHFYVTFYLLCTLSVSKQTEKVCGSCAFLMMEFMSDNTIKKKWKALAQCWWSWMILADWFLQVLMQVGTMQVRLMRLSGPLCMTVFPYLTGACWVFLVQHFWLTVLSFACRVFSHSCCCSWCLACMVQVYSTVCVYFTTAFRGTRM